MALSHISLCRRRHFAVIRPLLTCGRSTDRSSLTPHGPGCALGGDEHAGVTTVSANRFMHIRSNRFTPVLYWKQRGFPLCHTVRKWDWLRSAPVAKAFLPATLAITPACTLPRRIGFVSHFRIAVAPHTLRLASFRTCGPGILAGHAGNHASVRPTPADWLRFAFSVCLRPAHLTIGFVPHQHHLWAGRTFPQQRSSMS